jgi:hypothetical protein
MVRGGILVVGFGVVVVVGRGVVDLGAARRWHLSWHSVSDSKLLPLPPQPP